MRSVVVLALLWQTAVVLGLGAIHAPNNNNNRASSALPWVGTEVWSTDIKKSYADQVFATAGQFHVYARSYNNACDEQLVSLDMNDGIETSSASIKACVSGPYAQHLPFVATINNNLGVNVYALNSSSVTPLMHYPNSSAYAAIFSVGDYFFWFATNYIRDIPHLTTLIKIDPRLGTYDVNTVPRVLDFVAGLNHLFAIGNPDRQTVYCYSAATGDVSWTVTLTGSDVNNLAPAPSGDTVLIGFTNYSFSLFNSATGEWIWTTGVPLKNVMSGASLTAVFAANTVILNSEVGMEGLYPTNKTALDLTSGKIIWEIVGSPIDGSPSHSCVLKSNIYIGWDFTGDPYWNPTYNLIGLDVKTGKKVLDYAVTLPGDDHYRVDRVHCHNDDVYFVARNVPRQDGSDPHVVVQRITFSPASP